MNSSKDHVTLHEVQVLRNQQRSTTNPDGSITVHIPISFKKRGGRKYLIAPDAVPEAYYPPKESASILKAIAQAFHWKEMIDDGEVSSVMELSTKLKVSDSYITRVLRLNLLAPDIIKALLDGRQPQGLTLIELFKPVPLDWNEQRQKYGFSLSVS